MTVSAQYPSPTNVFIHDHAASGKMVVDYARNLADFPVNQYAQVVPVKKLGGYYLVMTVEEAGRLLSGTLDNFVWYDGDPAPEGGDGLESHRYLPFECVRRAFPFRLGSLTVENADWDIKTAHAGIKARQAMTARTQLVVNAATTASNYPTGHVLDVTSATDIPGNTGNWAQSTTARQDIRRSVNAAVKAIQRATLSAVRAKDLRLVIGPELAAAISESQEIVDYVKGSPFALQQLRGEVESRNAKDFGLPDQLYGLELVVENSYKVTSRKGAARVSTPILSSSYAIVCSRPGGLVGNAAGAPSFSTFTLFAYNEMQVYLKDDTDNQRVLGRVVETLDCRLTAPSAGVLLTNVS